MVARDYRDTAEDEQEVNLRTPEKSEQWDGWGETPVNSERARQARELADADAVEAAKPERKSGYSDDGWSDRRERLLDGKPDARLTVTSVDLEASASAESAERSGREADARAALDAALEPTSDVAIPGSHLKGGDDFRQEALDSFELDRESEARAAECGRKLAEEGLDQQWREGDFGARLDAKADIAEAARESLDVAPAQVMVEDLPRTLAGYSRGEVIGVGAWTLEEPAPEEIVKTIAHEYRHQWQDAVIRGDVEHPLGEAGQEFLTEGERTYAADLDDTSGRYSRNPRELDAEAFAIKTWEEYNQWLKII